VLTIRQRQRLRLFDVMLNISQSAKLVQNFRSARLMILALLFSALFHAMLVFSIPTKSKRLQNPVGENTVLQVSIAFDTDNLATIEPLKRPDEIDTQAQPSDLPPPLSTPATPPQGSTGLTLSDKYYEVRELDALPRPAEKIEPQYPSAALSDGVTGIVHLEIFIDEKGEVLSPRVVDATVPGVFDQAAIDAFNHRKFEPGLRNGAPVKSHLKLVVNFGENPDANRR
jgi:TonB family protein